MVLLMNVNSTIVSTPLKTLGEMKTENLKYVDISIVDLKSVKYVKVLGNVLMSFLPLKLGSMLMTIMVMDLSILETTLIKNTSTCYKNIVLMPIMMETLTNVKFSHVS